MNSRNIGDLLFASGLVSTAAMFTDSYNMFSSVASLCGLALLIGIPLYELNLVAFPDYDFELRVASILTMFFLYMISLGVCLALLSKIFKTGLLTKTPALFLVISSTLIIHLYSRREPSLTYPTLTVSTRLYKILFIGVSYIIVIVVFSLHLRFNQPLIQATTLYSMILALSIIGSNRKTTNVEKSIVLFIVALSLILHNELAIPILGAGDSDKEYYVSNIIMAQEYWPVSTQQSKFSVLTIVILNPIMSILFPVSLEGIYRFIYPILFSFMAPMLYFVYQSRFSRRVSYWGVLLLIFLHPFYTVFALNTRNGYVLLFMALLLVFYYCSQLELKWQKLLQIGLVFLLATTYYATGPIFIMVLAVAKVAQIIDSYWRGEQIEPSSRIPSNEIILFAIGTTAWLIYTTESYTFDLVAGVLIGTITEFTSELFSLSDSSGGSAFTQEFSYTYEIITYIYIFLTLLILSSLILISFIRYITDDGGNVSGSYYPMFIGGGLVFVAAFLPTSSLGIARLYTIGLIFLAPASFFGLCYISEHTSYKISNGIPVILIAILIVNTGLFGIAVGDNRITQQHLMDDDSGALRDYQASEWVLDFRESGETIYGSGDSDQLLGEFFVTEFETGVPGGYSLLVSDNQTGLIYLSSRSVEDQTITSKMWYRGGLGTEREYINYRRHSIENTSLVYTTGKSQVRYRP